MADARALERNYKHHKAILYRKCTENRRVGLQVDVAARPHRLEAADRDVLLVSETEANKIENHITLLSGR